MSAPPSTLRETRPQGKPLNLYPERERSAPAKGTPLFHFLVTGVLPARLAKLLRLQPVGMLLPVLGGRVIPVFAIVALQRDDFAHKVSSNLLDDLRDGACADRVAAFADREPQPLL